MILEQFPDVQRLSASEKLIFGFFRKVGVWDEDFVA